MVYIFVFLGEFGFELFNWQGVVRKLAGKLAPGDKVVCCSRASLYPLYEMADIYINISELPIFQRSRAFVYWAVPTREGVMDSPQALAFDRELKREIKTFVLERLATAGQLADDQPHRFVWSSDHTVLHGCTFGRPRGSVPQVVLANIYRGLKARLPFFDKGLEAIKSLLFNYAFSPDFEGAGNIYEKLDLDNNDFKRIEPDLSVAATVEEKLGWRLTEPYILCQIRIRETREISGDVLPKTGMNQLFSALAQDYRVVLLSFSTGRQFDSYSAFDDSSRCVRYSCGSFPEQACLIHCADHLLFFTEGDFGSHIYVPPMMGRDVTAVAPQSVYEILATSPVRGERADALTFWNSKVYRFGGQVIPRVAEEVFATSDRIAALAAEVVAMADSYSPDESPPSKGRKTVILWRRAKKAGREWRIRMSTLQQKASHLLKQIFDRRYRTLLKLEGGCFWDDVGPNQLAYLKAAGLRPEHRLLDLPCGCFRAGRLLIDYLEAGHYFGADANSQNLEKGRKYILEPEGLMAKDPDLRLLTLSAEPTDLRQLFGVRFDYVWVHALFDHIPHAIIRRCLADLSRVLVPGGHLYATIFLNPHGPAFREPLIHPRYGSIDGAIVTYPDREYWHHTLEFFAETCDGIPDLRLEECRFDYPHPYGLRMLSFARPAE